MYNNNITLLLLFLGISFTALCQKNDVILKSHTSTANKATNVARHHVVIQVSNNDTAAWKGLMNNIKHLKETWGDNVQIEVVAHGPGIELLMAAKTTQQINITLYKKTGVLFVACENSIRQRNITKADIVSEADFVPSGVAEVVIKEEKGWSYLKSGF